MQRLVCSLPVIAPFTPLDTASRTTSACGELAIRKSTSHWLHLASLLRPQLTIRTGLALAGLAASASCLTGSPGIPEGRWGAALTASAATLLLRWIATTLTPTLLAKPFVRVERRM